MGKILFKNTSELVDKAFKNLNKSGFHCVENALDKKFQKELEDQVFSLIKSNGNRYFSLVDVMSDKNLCFNHIGNNIDIINFLTALSRLALKRKIEKSDTLNVLRVITGKKTETQTYKFHYDAYSLTALIPIIIPEGPLEQSGHLVSFPNLRKFRSSFLVNFFEKLFFQNNVMRKILTIVLKSNIEKRTYIMKPGNIYLFWGYRTLHANLPVNPNYTRATLLLHFGDVHPRSSINSFIKTSRHSSEKANVDTG